jgi:hypothetical protein
MNLLQGFHNHHIIPRYKGGGDSQENLMLLHPIDHAIAHLVRFKIYKNPADGWAYNRIVNGLKDELIPNKKGIPKPYLRKPKSEETKAKMSLAATGKKKSPESVEKTRRALIGRTATDKQLECLALGRTRPDGYVSPLRGVPRPTPWLVGKTNNAPSREACVAGGKKAKGRKQTPEQVAKRVASRRATLLAQGRTS